MIAPASVSTMVFSRIGGVNSSGMSVSVAPAALPMPSARWPALRPIATTKYQRDVVLASTIRFLTISTPKWRAVWKPKVSTCGGQVEVVVDRLRARGRRGCGRRRALPSCIAEKAVSSPPMVMSCDTPRRVSESMRLVEELRILRRVRARDAQVRAAAEVDAADGRRWSAATTWSMSPSMSQVEAVADAEDIDALETGADRRRADDAVDAGSGPAAHENRELVHKQC